MATDVIEIVERGAQGPTNVLTFEVETLAPEADATVETTGESPAQHVKLGIPRGVIGHTGPANVLTAEAESVAHTAPAEAIVSGESPEQHVLFKIPVGAPNVLTATVTTLSPGSSATVTVTGESPTQNVHLGIPRGDVGPNIEVAVVSDAISWRVADSDSEWTELTKLSNLTLEFRFNATHLQWKSVLSDTWINAAPISTITGPVNTLSIGTVTTLAPGASATSTIEGAAPSQTLSLGIPQGDPGAPGEPLLATISDQNDIGPGGWWITRDYHGPATLQYLRAEMLAGTATGVTLNVRKNGVLHRGGITLSSTATIITDLALTLAKGDSVSVHREGGTITGPWLAAIQIDGRT